MKKKEEKISKDDNVIKILSEYGLKIEVMDLYDTIDDIGYNRCLTCPLERE